MEDLQGHSFTALNSTEKVQAQLVKWEAHFLPGVDGCVQRDSVASPLTHPPPWCLSSLACLIVLNAVVNGLFLNRSLGKSGLDSKSLKDLKEANRRD